MTQEEEEIGRFKPKGDPFSGPREPFLPDEMLEPNHKPDSPSAAKLQVPTEPLTKAKLIAFLEELRMVIESIQEMKRTDQHYVATLLPSIKAMLHASHFEEQVIRLFEKVADHFNRLLTHSTPIDRDTVASDIEQLLSIL